MPWQVGIGFVERLRSLSVRAARIGIASVAAAGLTAQATEPFWLVRAAPSMVLAFDGSARWATDFADTRVLDLVRDVSVVDAFELGGELIEDAAAAGHPLLTPPAVAMASRWRQVLADYAGRVVLALGDDAAVGSWYSLHFASDGVTNLSGLWDAYRDFAEAVGDPLREIELAGRAVSSVAEPRWTRPLAILGDGCFSLLGFAGAGRANAEVWLAADTTFVPTDDLREASIAWQVTLPLGDLPWFDGFWAERFGERRWIACEGAVRAQRPFVRCDVSWQPIGREASATPIDGDLAPQALAERLIGSMPSAATSFVVGIAPLAEYARRVAFDQLVDVGVHLERRPLAELVTMPPIAWMQSSATVGDAVAAARDRPNGFCALWASRDAALLVRELDRRFRAAGVESTSEAVDDVGASVRSIMVADGPSLHYASVDAGCVLAIGTDGAALARAWTRRWHDARTSPTATFADPIAARVAALQMLEPTGLAALDWCFGRGPAARIWRWLDSLVAAHPTGSTTLARLRARATLLGVAHVVVAIADGATVDAEPGEGRSPRASGRVVW